MQIIEARKARRMTQEEAAGHLGVSRPTYARMEKNPETVTIEDARKISKMFGVPVDDLFFDTDCKETYSPNPYGPAD